MGGNPCKAGSHLKYIKKRMIFMKFKKSVVFGLILAGALSSMSYAQENKLAFFQLDSVLGTTGYQGGSVVTGVAGAKRVGFAVYIKNVDQLRSIKVDFTWDGTKATYNTSSGANISLDEVAINGATVTMSETNMLGSVSAIPVANEAGHFAEDFAKLGGTAVSSTNFGLGYFFVLRTVDAFTTAADIAVTAKIKVANDGGTVKDLGERVFYVNKGSTDVQNATWGQVKNQFKDF